MDGRGVTRPVEIRGRCRVCQSVVTADSSTVTVWLAPGDGPSRVEVPHPGCAGGPASHDIANAYLYAYVLPLPLAAVRPLTSNSRQPITADEVEAFVRGLEQL